MRDEIYLIELIKIKTRCMGIKGLIILFLILLLVPVLMGKVPIGQFPNFFEHPSWEGFKSAFLGLFQDDLNFYKSLVAPLVDRFFEFIKNKIKETI
jgi:hypothetical protein